MAQQLGQVAAGSIVKIQEDSGWMNYFVAAHDYESGLNGTGNTLVVRMNPANQWEWNHLRSNAYAGSTIDKGLNYWGAVSLDPGVAANVPETKFYYTPGNGAWDVSVLERQFFLLSMAEFGSAGNTFNQEGQKLPGADAIKAAGFTSWTRTPLTSDKSKAAFVSTPGLTDGIGDALVDSVFAACPAFALPSGITVQDDGRVTLPDAPASIQVPSAIMEDSPIPISWSAVDGADSYVLERSVPGDVGNQWMQIYSGAGTSYQDKAGDWSWVQYRVKAGVNGVYGTYTKSGMIADVPVAALAISGSDGDLGTLVNDVPYTVLSSGNNPLNVTETVNGVAVRSFTAENGGENVISVLDLPTGYGTITIKASTTASSGPVTVTRDWTYNKAAEPFPDAGSVDQLKKNGKFVFPQTLAEAVRVPGLWGGNLGLALQKLTGAVTFVGQTTGRYQAVNVDLSNASVGDEILLPCGGAFVTHIVVHIGNPDASLYDASCDGVWLMRKDMGAGRGTFGNLTFPGSAIYDAMDDLVPLYDSTVQSAIKTVKIPYKGSPTDPDGDIWAAEIHSGADGCSCRIFPLSPVEIGYTTADETHIAIDGAKLDYFDTGDSEAALSKRAGTQEWWTRQWLYSSGYIITVATSGSDSREDPAGQGAYRPTFLLPQTFTATYYMDDEGGFHAEQDYTAAGTYETPAGDSVPVPAGQFITYTGDGAASRQIQFTRKPDLFLVAGDDAIMIGYAWFGQTIVIFDTDTTSQAGITSANVSWDGATLTITGNGDASVRMNTSGQPYWAAGLRFI